MSDYPISDIAQIAAMVLIIAGGLAWTQASRRRRRSWGIASFICFAGALVLLCVAVAVD